MISVKDFLLETINQIDDAMAEYNASKPEGGIGMAFYGTGDKSLTEAGFLRTRSGLATQVKFDIAVTAEDSVQGGGKAEVKVAGIFSGGMGGDGSRTNTNVSRVQFTLPLSIPVLPDKEF